MNKEIETIAKDLCHVFGGRNDYETCGDCFGGKNKYYGCQSFAERLYNTDYRKIVWHKVADGDLPKEGSEVVLVVLEWLGVLYYSAGAYTKSSGWYLSNNVNANAKIIAWTELPKYEGEE